jgi:hypothetical protein
MESQLIYILDGKLSSAQLKEQIEKTQPMTKEEVVDLIISKIVGQAETDFNAFKNKYEKSSFLYKSNEKKYKIYLNDLEKMENVYQYLRTWNDPNELRTDLLKDLVMFQIIDEKTVLFNYQIENWIIVAAGWQKLCDKRQYLEQALKMLQNSINAKIESHSQTHDDISKTRSDNLGSDSDSKQTKKDEKKVSEKWYALLHMIYIQMKKEIAFEKKISKEELKEFGRKTYHLKGSGHSFYMAIRHIGNLGIYKYISRLTKTDYRKWKKTIIKISKDDSEIISWIDKNKY